MGACAKASYVTQISPAAHREYKQQRHLHLKNDYTRARVLNLTKK